MTYRTVFNPGDQPVALGDGSSIGGGEWGTVLTTTDGVTEAVGTGRLMYVDEPDNAEEAVLDPGAAHAFARTRDYAERGDTLKDTDKAALMKHAVKAQLVQEDDDMPVGELRDLLVRSGVDLPKSRTKSTTNSEK